MVFFDDNIFILSFILIGLYTYYILTHQYAISDCMRLIYNTYMHCLFRFVFHFCGVSTYFSRITLHMFMIYAYRALELPSVGIGRLVCSRPHKSGGGSPLFARWVHCQFRPGFNEF